MNGLRGMHEERGCTRGGEGGTHLLADDPRLAHAHRHHAPVARGDELDRVDEVLIEMLDEAEDGRGFDFEDALCFFDCRMIHARGWYGKRETTGRPPAGRPRAG